MKISFSPKAIRLLGRKFLVNNAKTNKRLIRRHIKPLIRFLISYPNISARRLFAKRSNKRSKFY